MLTVNTTIIKEITVNPILIENARIHNVIEIRKLNC